ncbi:uncharacterized protein LOC111272277 isoform X2 [Varroa jacobsoni]|uniref:uncharacterized protein LOC111272277 isoform X2 n=1 Tax=Varroa jacobsoni TaxID=62625 RepID=UPI000BF924C4|nr:uncharacterized protein LOC111272277 isoform X2 [Varroa jacobsoni]
MAVKSMEYQINRVTTVHHRSETCLMRGIAERILVVHRDISIRCKLSRRHKLNEPESGSGKKVSYDDSGQCLSTWKMTTCRKAEMVSLVAD